MATQPERDAALANLVARPCPLPPAEWLRRNLDAGGQTSKSALARRRHHERMLAYLADPAERPLVSVVIPVHNRAAMLIEAVQSCLAQTWRPIEVVVVDDGSDDNPAAALEPFGDAVRLLRQENGGVASARNAGIGQARGDFVHLLDSDDMLRPDAIARKVAAFAAIPDAGLCFSMAAEQTAPGLRGATIARPDGSAECATSDLLIATVGRCPFYTTTAMLPRWVMLDAAPFEQDLRRGEDTRYFFRLGLSGVKAIGFDEEMTVRRLTGDGLSAKPPEPIERVEVRLRILRDLIGAPLGWYMIARTTRYLAKRLVKSADLRPEDVHDMPAFGALVAAIAALGDGRDRDGLSPVPLLADIRDAGVKTPIRTDPRWKNLWHALDRAAESALSTAAPVTPRDAAHWQTRCDQRETRNARQMLEIAREYPTLATQVDRMLRRGHPSPTPRSIRRYRCLRRIVRSERLAGRLTWPALYAGGEP